MDSSPQSFLYASLESALAPLWGRRPIPHSVEWSAQFVRYIQVFAVVCNMVVAASSETTKQLRLVMPYINWLGLARADLSEGQQVYFAAFYGACAWTFSLATLFMISKSQLSNM